MNQTLQDLLHKGTTACERNEFQQGEELFAQALEIDPDNTRARYNRAKALYQLKRLDDAAAEFDELIARDPENAHLYGERAIIRFMQNDHKGTLADLDKAVDLQPEKPYRYASRAFLKDRMGDPQGALQDYEQAIRLDPDDAISHNNKGLVEEKLGRIAQSKKSFARADKLDPAYSPDNKPVPEVPDTPRETSDRPEGTKLTVRDYFRQINRLITSPEERAEFRNYLRNLFR